MKLTELSPRWLESDGRRVGFVFFCPHCIAAGEPFPWPLSVFFESPQWIVGDGEDSQYGLFLKHLPLFGEDYETVEPNEIVPCKRGYNWTRQGDDFETMSVTPSLDASASGHWHGFITNGECR